MKVRITKVPDKKQDSLNSRKWKHGDGGLLDKLGSVYGNDRVRMLDVIKKARQK